MSLGAKKPNSSQQHMQPLVLNDDNDMEVFDFSTLRDELADGLLDEQAYDDTVESEETGIEDSLGFEFSTEINNYTSTTFEEEAFGVKKSERQMNQGNVKQSQPNIWNKDPFSGPSYGTQPSKAGDHGNQVKKITRRINPNPPPVSREISAGVSFASILSGSANLEQEADLAPVTETDPTNKLPPKAPQSPPPKASQSPPPETNPSSPSTLILQEIKPDGQKHSQISDPTTQPAVYSVADIEAKMGQRTSNNKNLLYQLLPGLSQQHTPSAEPPQHPSSTQGSVDINSFFQKHQQQQHPPPTAATQRSVDINSFFQKHEQQQQQARSANSTVHQLTETIHKPNMTTEQELKQKEDDGKDSYDGLMTAKNVKYIDQMERSKLADLNQHSNGDFYYHMYTANHGSQLHAPPVMNQPPNAMIYQQEQSDDSRKDRRVALDNVLEKVIQERDCREAHPCLDDKKQPKNDHQQLLKTIESIYFLVLQVEQSYREMPGNPASPTSTTRQATLSKIWNTLAMDQSPPTVVAILKVNKGMSLIGRLVPHLDESQHQILMTTIAYYFADILSSPSINTAEVQGSHHQQRQNVDYIHPSISRCLEHIFYSASLSYISKILSSVSTHSDFKLLVGTPTGQHFLGTLLFHAKGKQQQQQEESDNEDWKMEYGFYFDKAMASSSLIKNMTHLDNLSVWMLLNSMAVCCDAQQKESMAQAYRETVSMTMKTISDLERNHVPVPYPIQVSYPVMKELWSNLSLADESLTPDGRP